MRIHPPAAPAALLACLCFCAASPDRPSVGETYVKRIAFEVPVNESVLLRWSKRDMPLRVHLPPPPEGLFEESDAVYDSVRDGVLDWTDVAGPGLPRFELVDDQREADIPIVWAAEPDGHWYIAHTVWDIQPFARRFGVARVLVTGRCCPDRPADLHELYAAVLHEMGHALGIGGHSADPSDVMHASLSDAALSGLSERDRATLRLVYAWPIGKRVVGARRD